MEAYANDIEFAVGSAHATDPTTIFVSLAHHHPVCLETLTTVLAGRIRKGPAPVCPPIFARLDSINNCLTA